MAPQTHKIREMFNDISGRYDFLNHFLSFGIDRCWRKRVVREIRHRFPGTEGKLMILDMATGTGDLAIAMASLKPDRIEGVDVSPDMMAIGKTKVAERNLQHMIVFTEAAAEKIPFPDDSFDAVTVAFGVRNFENREQGLSEMRRVMKPGGLMLVLEFSHPRVFPFKQLFRLYSRFVIPAVGMMVSGSRQAYTYLPESAAAFPSGRDFLKIMEDCRLKNVRQIPLTLGIASIYSGEK